MMVSQNSAMLHSAHELRVPCDEDHTHIAKLRRTEASLYHIIKGHIQQALEKFEASESYLQPSVSGRPEIACIETRTRGQSPGKKSPQRIDRFLFTRKCLSWMGERASPPLFREILQQLRQMEIEDSGCP